MIISNDKIEEIRSSVDIVDVVSQYVQLRKKGANHTGLCPFHQEKTPSFNVNAQKQIYKCFGCQEHGDVFNFVMKIKNVSFPEAAKELADEAGIVVEYKDAQAQEYYDENEKLFDMNEAAAEFYSSSLINNISENPGYNYLKNRHLKKETISLFRLGFSPGGRNALVKHLSDKNLDLDLAVTLGLTGKDESGSYYDRLPGRVIFPIFSANGRVIAFAGRSLDPNVKSAKYINSPESAIYYKSNVLYGLYQAKEHIRAEESVILVEGYMDLISLYQNNIKNVVAVSGTAFTEPHAKLITRFTKNIYLLFDSDSAGIKGTLRSLESLLRHGLNIRVITLPPGDDPDSFINNSGDKAFKERVKTAVDFLEFQFGVYEREAGTSDPFKVSEMIRRILRPLTAMPDELMRESLIKSVAKKFDIREGTLFREFEKILSESQKDSGRRRALSEQQETPKDKKQQKSAATSKETIAAEREILILLINSTPEVAEFALETVKAEEFSTAPHRNIFENISAVFEEYGEVSVPVLLSKVTEREAAATLADISMDKYSVSDKWQELLPEQKNLRSLMLRYFIDALKKLRVSKIENELQRLIEKSKASSSEDEKREILAEILSLNNRKNEIISELSGFQND